MQLSKDLRGPLTKEEQLRGGRNLELLFKDGTRSTFMVREVSLVDYDSYKRAIGDTMVDELALYLDMDIKQLLQLTPKSLRQSREVGRIVNSDFFDMAQEDLNPAMAALTEETRATLTQVEGLLGRYSESSPASDIPSETPDIGAGGESTSTSKKATKRKRAKG